MTGVGVRADGRTELSLSGSKTISPLRRAVRAGHLRIGRRSADFPGRFLYHRRGPRAAPRRCRHKRLDRRLQPVLRPQQLHRARQLLALAVEPYDQRGRRYRLPGGDGLLGGLAGRAFAAGQCQRQAVPDGLLQRLTGLRQRRVHRRLPVHRLNRRQRFPAAVGDKEQQPGRVEQRSMEPGLLRRPRRSRAVVRRAGGEPLHHARHLPGDRRRAVPLHRPARQLQRLRPRGPARFVRAGLDKWQRSGHVPAAVEGWRPSSPSTAPRP
jgi:hypothetical protein